MDLILCLILIAVPFQLIGVLSYFIGINKSFSLAKRLMILTPIGVFWVAFIVWMFIQPLVEGFWRDLEILFRIFCFIVGTIINLVLALILLSMLSKKQKVNLEIESL